MLKRNVAISGIRKYAAPTSSQTTAEGAMRRPPHLAHLRRAPLERDVEEHHRREHDEHPERERLALVRVRVHVAGEVGADQDRDERQAGAARQRVRGRVGGERVAEEQDHGAEERREQHRQRRCGARTGAELAPRFDDASLHSCRRPSIAGAITRIISGIWKYR